MKEEFLETLERLRHKLIAKRIKAIKNGEYLYAEKLWLRIARLDNQIRDGKK